jgi:hypothetical protein
MKNEGGYSAMIRLTDAKFDTVKNTKPGDLVIYLHSSKQWLRCLAVTYTDEQRNTKVTDLLPLEENEKFKEAFIPLSASDDEPCISLGKAEFSMLPGDLAFPDAQSSASAADLGHMALGSTGAAIIGLRDAKKPKVWWLISTGQVVTPQDDPPMPFARKWKVGTMNAVGVFAEALSFPLT